MCIKTPVKVIEEFQNNGIDNEEYVATMQELMETYCVSNRYADKTKEKREHFIDRVREMVCLVRDVNMVNLPPPS